ncbi:phospholipase C type enzyme [Ceratobasidium sp. 395]|nr:phospholipase C type enzyme [Ceratobasidium sp. 395]
MVALRLVLSLFAAAGLAAAAPAQAVFGLADTERVTTQATISQAVTIVNNNDHDESRIRVLTFNCWGLRFVSQHRLARITAIAERILNATPGYDIVALQELWLKSDHALIAEAVAPVLPHSTVFYSGAFGSGLSLFSRFPIEQAQMHPFALAGDPIDVLGGDWFVGKGVAAATVAHPVLGHIEILTSHMFARGGETGTVLQQAHRLVGAWEYSQLIRRAAQLGRYVIVAGDFNAVDGSAPLEFIRAHAKVQDAWWATHNLSSPAVPMFPAPMPRLPPARQESATSALTAIHEHGVTADSPLNSWSAGKPLDAVARRHLGKRLDYVLYRGPDAQAEWELVAKEAKVVMTERMPDLGVSLSDHFGVEVELELAPYGVSTSTNGDAEFEPANTPSEPTNIEFESASTNNAPLPPLPIPPPIARTRALILHDTLHVLHAAIPASYAASTAYLTTGLACAFSLLALAVAAGAVGWGPNVRRRHGQRSTRVSSPSPARVERKQSRPRAHTTGSPPSPSVLNSTPAPSPPTTPLDIPPPPFRLPLPFLPPKSAWSAKRPIQAPWWLGIVLVLAGALLAAAGTTLLYAAVLFGRWERNAIWDVVDQMERVQARGGIGM